MPSTATSILDGLSTSVAAKAPCRAVASGNITLAGLQTLSGYTVVENDRVLVPNQTNPIDNGIYSASSGNWTRTKDFDGNRDVVQGTIVLVRNGAADGAIYEVTTANPIVIGTTAITFRLSDDPAIRYDQTPEEIAAAIIPANYAYPPGNVLRYGADPTGAADSTSAFRQACMSTYADWPLPLVDGSAPWAVTIPGGKYRLLDTVYVRSGVSIKGAGMSTLIDASGFDGAGNGTKSVFKLGHGLIGGVDTQDAGGYPPELANMFFNGGPSGGGACVHQDFPGGLIHDIWCAASGLGVYLAGGYLYDSEFDLGLIGVRVGPSTNQTIDNCRFFHQNYCLDFDTSSTDIADCIISNCTFEYARVIAVQIPNGTGKVRGLKFIGCKFPHNPVPGNYPDFVTLVYITSEACLIEFDGCNFQNWPNYAVTFQADLGELELSGCTFDGAKTHTSFVNSTTAAGIDFSLGTLRLNTCRFRNLSGVGILFSGASAATLEIDGLSYAVVLGASVVSITNTEPDSVFYADAIKGDGVTPFVNNQSAVRLGSIRGTKWVGDIDTASSRDYVLIPYQSSSVYQITVTANQNIGGSGSYRKSSTLLVQKDNEFSGSAKSYLNVETLIEGAAHTNGVLDIDVDFGAVGGGAEIASSNSGSLAVSWPDSYSLVSVDVQLIQSG